MRSVSHEHALFCSESKYLHSLYRKELLFFREDCFPRRCQLHMRSPYDYLNAELNHRNLVRRSYWAHIGSWRGEEITKLMLGFIDLSSYHQCNLSCSSGKSNRTNTFAVSSTIFSLLKLNQFKFFLRFTHKNYRLNLIIITHFSKLSVQICFN